MPARILVVGSANMDFTIAVPRLPAVGETVSEGTLLVNHGGKGANQAVAARRLGAEVRFIACVGEDSAGLEIRRALEEEGVGIAGVMGAARAATGTAVIVVDAEGRNQIAVAPGANRALTSEHVRSRFDDFAWAQVVVCSLEIPLEAVAAALGAARDAGATTVVNPAPVPQRPIEFWALVDYLTPNEREAERLTGIAAGDRVSAGRAGLALRERGVDTAIVTLGAEGAIVIAAATVEHVGAFPVRAVDTTAAGDAFNAGLAVGLGEGRDRLDALRLASATAALTCTKRGAQDSLPLRVAVDALLGS